MKRKPWPWTMKTVVIVDFALVALQVVLAVVLIGMYIAQIHRPADTDSFISFALFGGLMLVCMAVILGVITALLLTRSPLARIVYTIMLIIGVTASFTIGQWYAAGPNLLLIGTIVLIWLPQSGSFFSDLPGVTYYKNNSRKNV